MNGLLIGFIIVLIIAILNIAGIVLTIKLFHFKKRDFMVCLLLIGTLSVGALFFGVTKTLNDKLSNTYKFTKELYASQDIQDSCINDSILTQYLKDMRIPHSKIIMAQAKLESNNYKSELYKSNYNLFGMKVATQRVSNTSSDKNGYQSYCNWRESVMDYVLWQFTNKLDRLSDNEYFEYLSKRYAEDPNYVGKLKKLIKN